MKTALILDDHREARQLLAQALGEALPGVTIEQAATLGQAREYLRQRRFDLALLDISLPDGDGVAFVGELLGALPDSQVVMVTIHDEDYHLFNALRAGAGGYLVKGQPGAGLAEQLKGLLDGNPPLSPAIASRILEHFHQPSPPAPLTPRETEVLSLIATGCNRREIAGHLGISPHTVAEYTKHIYEKLNIGSRAEAALAASRLGLVDPGG